MPNIFRDHARLYQSGDGTTAYTQSVDLANYTLALDLFEAGWNVDYRWNISHVITTTNMADFPTTLIGGGHVFWAVFPPNYSGDPGDYPGGIPMVVNRLPDGGYTPPAGFYIRTVTGSTDKIITHVAIVDAILSWDPLHLESVGPDPDEPNPNTFIQFRQTGPFPVAQEILIGNPPAMPQPAIALGTSAPALSRGGYACTCQPNGNSENYASLFLTRSQVSGIEPFPAQMFLAKTIPDQPVHLGLVEDVTRTEFVFMPLALGNWTIAANDHMCVLGMTSVRTAHIELIALDLPVASVGRTEAVIGVAEGETFGGTRLRDVLSCSGAAQRIAIDGGTRYGSGTIGDPRTMALWAPDTLNHPWEGGLAQISEPWMAANLLPSQPAPVIGKIPDCIVVNKKYTSIPEPFRFDGDGKTYKIFTQDRGLGDVTVAALAFVTPDEAELPGCP